MIFVERVVGEEGTSVVAEIGVVDGEMTGGLRGEDEVADVFDSISEGEELPVKMESGMSKYSKELKMPMESSSSRQYLTKKQMYSPHSGKPNYQAPSDNHQHPYSHTHSVPVHKSEDQHPHPPNTSSSTPCTKNSKSNPESRLYLALCPLCKYTSI